MEFFWQDLFAIALDQPLWFPSTVTFVLKAFSTLEGVLPLSPFLACFLCFASNVEIMLV
jgi:hypothetical protein